MKNYWLESQQVPCLVALILFAPLLAFGNARALSNGDIVMALPNGGTSLEGLEEGLRLEAAARDASGNFASTSTVLQVTK